MTATDGALPMIAGTAALTFLIRYLPMVVLAQQRLRPTLERFVRHLPIGILAALVGQSTFLREGTLSTATSDHYLPGLVAALWLAISTRSLAAVVFGGLAVVALLTYFGAG
ncbi:hypothetical protein BAC2_01392 [uncultured bacterium]|nr:hypothetical protein BAC2_01392 [uncultured bacterium]